MSTLIQCPACSKKYNLKGRLPAVFNCTGCQQPMDLTGFPGYEPEPAPAAPARSAGAGRGGAPARGAGGRRRGGRDDDEGDGRRERFQAPKKDNTPLIIGGVALVVTLAVVLLLTLGKKDEPAPAPAAGTTAGGAAPADPSSPTGTEAPGTPASPGTPAPASPGAPSPGASSPGSSSPGASSPSPVSPGPGPTASPGATDPVKPPRPEGPPPRASSGTLQSWPYPDDVTPAERQQIDEAVDAAITKVGVDLRRAQELLESMKHKAVHRLVSEFKLIHDTKTFETKEGRIAAMIVDRNLRRIDGFMERKGGFRQGLNPESSPDYILKVAKKWNAWIELGLWKTPLTPWDPRVDEADESTPR